MTKLQPIVATVNGAPDLSGVRKRTQKATVESNADGDGYLVMFENGAIEMAATKKGALTIIKRRAARRNPGITITIIEWRTA